MDAPADISDDENAASASLSYVKPYLGPSFEDLPMEILLNILAYLHPSDLFESSLTCRRWFEAAQYFTQHSTALNFSHCNLCETIAPISVFKSPVRQYTAITLEHVEFGSAIPSFWQCAGETVQHLAIRNSDLREKNLKSILLHIQNLRRLTIENCRELFMSGRLFESDQPAICAALKDVECLALINNRYLSDALFQRFVSLMPKLHSINVSGCHISFHKGLYRKFYPDRQKEASESVLTFHYISQFIECEAAQLKSMDFSGTLIDGAALQVLAAMEQLHLEVLEMRSCDQLTNSGIISLVQVQTGLQHLDLTASVRLTDMGLIEICRCLPDLKVLKLRRCRALTDIGVREIKNLRKLRELDISECDAITSAGIVDGIASERNARIRELSLSALNICALAIIRVAENFPELRKLDLSFCKNGVTNLVVQWICRHLVLLRDLNLEYCEKISDNALTGIDMATAIRNFETDKSATPPADDEPIDPDLPADHHKPGYKKISLRSKAEEDIVNDAKRKKFMLTMFERRELITSSENCSGFSIDSLRGLRTLRLTACNRVTDVSLKFAFNLRELHELSLSKCQQISSVGIASLIRQCPSLAVVELAECHNIDDKTIEMLTVYLKRLTHLDLERSHALTDHSLDSLVVNCDRLRYLNVRGCRSMCSEPAMRLESLRSLRDCIQSKPGPYMMSIPYKRPPRPPVLRL